VSERPGASELLATPGAVLDRRALYDLGYQRRTVDWIFRTLPVLSPPGVRRTYVYSDDVRRLLAENTYTEERVRPT
jgi:hypothetical protein